MAWYLDTSAFLKLVVAEPETPGMRDWLSRNGPAWSSQLLQTEARRAARRLGLPEETVETALDTVSLVLPLTETYRAAGRLEPADLRSLDALHLAAALEMGDDLDGIVTYDARMAAGAVAAGVTVASPQR